MQRFWFALMVFFAPVLNGCELIGDIFKAGVWVGVIGVVVVIGIIVWIISKAVS